MARAKFATVETDGSVLTFAWVDGSDRSVIDTQDLPKAIRDAAIPHGIKQKIMDRVNTKAESIDQAKMLFEAAVAQLAGGEWNARAEGTGGIIVEALHRVTGHPLDACRAVVKELSPADKRRLERKPEIAAAIADIHRERAEAAADGADDAGGIDLDAMFGGDAE